MSKDTGGPAFPDLIRPGNDGMTLRDYFAAEALRHPYTQEDDAYRRADKAAAWAYALADAMLAERAK